MEATGKDGRAAQLCRQCHAEIAAGLDAEACPACGGALTVQPLCDAEQAGMPARPIDRRGILLPRRHAVGGIITPR